MAKNWRILKGNITNFGVSKTIKPQVKKKKKQKNALFLPHHTEFIH